MLAHEYSSATLVAANGSAPQRLRPWSRQSSALRCCISQGLVDLMPPAMPHSGYSGGSRVGGLQDQGSLGLVAGGRATTSNGGLGFESRTARLQLDHHAQNLTMLTAPLRFVHHYSSPSSPLILPCLLTFGLQLCLCNTAHMVCSPSSPLPWPSPIDPCLLRSLRSNMLPDLHPPPTTTDRALPTTGLRKSHAQAHTHPHTHTQGTWKRAGTLGQSIRYTLEDWGLGTGTGGLEMVGYQGHVHMYTQTKQVRRPWSLHQGKPWGGGGPFRHSYLP